MITLTPIVCAMFTASWLLRDIGYDIPKTGSGAYKCAYCNGIETSLTVCTVVETWATQT